MPDPIVSGRPLSSLRRLVGRRGLGAIGIGLLVAVSSCGSEPEAEEVASRRPATPRTVPDSGPRGRVTSGRFYVPTYSHIYVREGIAEDLAVTVSIHNVSVKHDLVLESVRYYDTSGKLLEEFMKAPGTLGPLETVEFFISTNDRRGGSGANAIVSWHSDSPVVPPLVEAVMVRSISTNQAYAFTTRAIELPTDSVLPEQPLPAPKASEDEDGEPPPPVPSDVP